MRIADVRVRATGTVKHPLDLVAAARRELTAENFDALMKRTAGKPSAHDLIRACEAQRAQLSKPAGE